MLGILCLFLSAALAILVPAGLRAEPPASAPRTVTAVLQADYPPTCFKDPKSGKLQGLAVDIMDEVARRAGIRVNYVIGRTWQEAQQMVLDGRADVIPTLTVDEERRKRLAFTTPVDILPISYIVRNDGLFNGPRGGMRMGVMRGSAAHAYLLERNDIQLVPYDSLRRLLSDLLSDDLDILLAPAPSVVKLALDLGFEDHLKVLQPPALEGVRAMAVRPGDPELLAVLNRALNDFVGTPEYRAISFKWWGKPKPFWTTAKVAWTLALCTLAMGYWRYRSVLRLNRTLGQTLEQLERSREELHAQTKLLEQEVAERQRTQESLAAQQRQLEGLNEVLARGINEAVAELRHKDQMLIQQGRLAAMGEMINNIAHQWRQPLNNIGLIVQNLQLGYESGDMTAAEMNREVNNAMDVILHMSHTIDDFRNFFRQDREKSAFSVNSTVSRCLEFVAASLGSCHIRVEVSDEEQVMATGYQNEYAQVLLNILNNARDVLMERRIATPRIAVWVSSANGRSLVAISDNGGGIAEDILPRIFDPYFTTKEPGKGTGIGLYMSKVIVEQHMNGRLTARNAAEGAEFRIEV